MLGIVLGVSVALNVVLGAIVAIHHSAESKAGAIVFQSIQVKDARDEIAKFEQTHDIRQIQDATAKLFVVSGQYQQYSYSANDGRFSELSELFSDAAWHLSTTHKLDARDEQRLNLYFKYLPDDNNLMKMMEKNRSQYLSRVQSLVEDLYKQKLIDP